MIKSNYGKFLSIPRTGMISACPFAAVPTGWVMLDGRTIGSFTSGATSRAATDTQALYELIWNSIANTFAAVPGGRGASATADFQANKPIALPDLRGASIIAPDNLGGTAAARITVAGIGNNAQNMGQRIGNNVNTLTLAHLPTHTHTYTLTSVDPTHSHTVRGRGDGDLSSAGAGANSGNYLPQVNVTPEAVDTSSGDSFPSHTHTVVFNNSVSSQLPHDNMMATWLVYWMVKL